MRTDPRDYKKLIFCKLCGKKIFVENLNKQYCNDCISLRGANGTKKIPNLTNNEMIPYYDLRREAPIEFNTNNTNYLFNQIIEFIKKKHVFRCSIMGRTRMGKSEVGSTLCFWYTKVFNKIHEEDNFKEIENYIDKNVNVNVGHISFNENYVCDNQSDYHYKMTERFKEQKLLFGQIWQIDEEKQITGGVGSMSEHLEQTNLNNITAKFCQNEIWIQPQKFESRNTPFGLKVVKQDFKNKYNWCHLYMTDQDPRGFTFFKFMGWVCIPLHNNEEFRAFYNAKKDKWIAKELSGGSDPRMELRSKTADWIIENHPKIFEMKENGKGFILSSAKQLVHLNRLIQKGEIRNFNQTEKEMIIDECQVISQENWSEVNEK